MADELDREDAPPETPAEGGGEPKKSIPMVKIGIIAAPNPDYDAKHWWRYSEGVREVTGEGLAYLYAKLFFYP